MSSLSNLPYGDIIDYWYTKLNKNKYKWRFILTKYFEIYSFKKFSNVKSSVNVDPVFNEVSAINEIDNDSSIGVVIPAYIRNDFDLQCINRLTSILLKQTNNKHKIFVVDDNSPIDYNLSNDVFFIKQDINSGPATARNTGIDKALSENVDIVVFTDVDCVPSENWLSSIIEGFIFNNNYHVLSGNTFSYNNTWCDKYHEINGTLNGRRFKTSSSLLYGPTCNLAVISSIVKDRKFNTNFPLAAGEDIEFCYKIMKDGFKIGFNEKMIINHDYNYGKFSFIKNLKNLQNQFQKYAKGENTLLKEIPEYYNYFELTEEISCDNYT